MDLKTLEDIPAWEWPADTDKLLLDILGNVHADETDRLLAAELAGDCVVINDALAEVLLTIVKNGQETVPLRSQAAISLGPALDYADTMEFDDEEDILISEEAFRRVKESLEVLYRDPTVPKDVRRGILEASVRAPQSWHEDAVRAAYSSDDEDWRLTAVFCMQYIPGFNAQILEALDSKNSDINYYAVTAAGNWQVDAAWPHVTRIIKDDEADKALLIAAIDALVGIRPAEAAGVIGHLSESDDDDIVDTVFEALAMAEGLMELDDDNSGDVR